MMTWLNLIIACGVAFLCYLLWLMIPILRSYRMVQEEQRTRRLARAQKFKEAEAELIKVQELVRIGAEKHPDQTAMLIEAYFLLLEGQYLMGHIPDDGRVIRQRPGTVFIWPKFWRMTADNGILLAIPSTLVTNCVDISSVIHFDNGVQVDGATEPNVPIRALLLADQSAWLSKSCLATVVPQSEGDEVERSFRLIRLPENTSVRRS